MQASERRIIASNCRAVIGMGLMFFSVLTDWFLR